MPPSQPHRQSPEAKALRPVQIRISGFRAAGLSPEKGKEQERFAPLGHQPRESFLKLDRRLRSPHQASAGRAGFCPMACR